MVNLNWEQAGKGENVFRHVADEKEEIIIINGTKEFIEAKNKRLF